MNGEILFLFNHDAPHQVAHIAGIAKAARELDRTTPITCACSTPAIRARVRAALGEGVSDKVEWFDFALPAWREAALAVPNLIAPVRRLRRLDYHAARLNAAAVVVSAERTCLRARAPRSGTRFVYVPHGAGDRAVAYHPDKGGFDLILVSGEKTAREMVSRGVAAEERVRVVGYPKFDTVDLSRRERFFANERPVFVYNPHFDPFLSSWYSEGPALLDWFADGDGQAFNLIFAPHIMLFRKKLHISLEYRTARLRPDIEKRWREAENILIDTGGRRLVDMSYTLGADAYIGDVSSQVYEFLIRPRPVFFLDTFSHDPSSKEDAYPAWKCGDVATSAEELARLLPFYAERLAPYRKEQEAVFSDTVSHNPSKTASRRAATEILKAAAQ